MVNDSLVIRLDTSEVDAAIAKLHALNAQVDDVQSRLATLRASASRALTTIAEGNAALAQQAAHLADSQTPAPEYHLCPGCRVIAPTDAATLAATGWHAVNKTLYCARCWAQGRAAMQQEGWDQW